MMRIFTAAALLLVAATSCLAQTFTTSTVDVILEGCAVDPPKITVVPNGNEGAAFRVERIGPNRWRANDLSKRFNARGQSASLRLGGERTGCETSREMRDPGDPNRWIAVFTFHCTQGHFWRALTIETKPATVLLTYARVMPDAGCVDRRADNQGTATMDDVAADRESIFVNLGGEPPRAYTDYSIAILRGSFGNHALQARPLVVSRSDLLDELMVRLANSGRVAPQNSGSSRALHSLLLGKFDQMTVTVK